MEGKLKKAERLKSEKLYLQLYCIGRYAETANFLHAMCVQKSSENKSAVSWLPNVDNYVASIIIYMYVVCGGCGPQCTDGTGMKMYTKKHEGFLLSRKRSMDPSTVMECFCNPSHCTAEWPRSSHSVVIIYFLLILGSLISA